MSFAEIFEQTYERIYAYAYRHTGTRSEAEELTAVIFQSVMKAYPRFRHQGRPLLGWLYAVAGRRVRPVALAQLGQVDRAVIDLHHFAGLSDQEMAQVLGISVDTAQVRLQRAVRRLSTELGPQPGPQPPQPEHREALRNRLLMGAEQPASEEPVHYTVISLPPLGDIYLGYSDQGVSFLTGAARSEEEFAAQVRERYRCGVVRDDSRQVRWQTSLERWLQGGKLPVAVDLSRVTAFERTVLEKVQQIGRGSVRPYQWLANEVGKPGGSRAIGNVMARNPVPLFVPCHRVVAASGVIGNYSMGGPLVKRLLLELEGVDVDRLQKLAAGGWRYKASKTHGTYCFPTCREIQPQHELLFKSAAEAERAGFTPCRVCRPS